MVSSQADVQRKLVVVEVIPFTSLVLYPILHDRRYRAYRSG